MTVAATATATGGSGDERIGEKEGGRRRRQKAASWEIFLN